MKLRVWGARGSVPVSGAEYVKYGGDTTCLEVETNSGQTLILDAGTGARALGNRALRDGRKTFHLLFTHAHWDHFLGFPFFKPLYRPDTKVHVHGCLHARTSLRKVFSNVMQAPFFPVKLEDVGAELIFHDDQPPDLSAIGLECQPIPLSHPNGGCGFRITDGLRTFAFLPDNELTLVHPGGQTFDEYVDLLHGVDLLIHDAEYLPDEYERFSRGWGHSVYSDTVRLGIGTEARRLVLWHLNQDHPDDQLDEMAASAQEVATSAGSTMECLMARTGLELEL